MSKEKPLTEHEVQRICSKLVDREIIYNMSRLVFELTADGPDSLYIGESLEIWQGPATWGEYTCPDCGQVGQGEPAQDRVCLGHLEDSGKTCHNVLDLDCDFEPTEYAEVFEHWLVSDWLADKLEEHGETVTRDFVGGLTIWSRCTTGQAIALDAAIRDIAQDMGILKRPQADSWLALI